MTRSPEEDAKAIVRMLLEKGLKAGESLKNPILMRNALGLGIDNADLENALTYAGDMGWIANGINDTTILTEAGQAAASED